MFSCSPPPFEAARSWCYHCCTTWNLFYQDDQRLVVDKDVSEPISSMTCDANFWRGARTCVRAVWDDARRQIGLVRFRPPREARPCSDRLVLVSSSADAVAAPPTTIGASQSNGSNSNRSSGGKAHFACLTFISPLGTRNKRLSRGSCLLPCGWFLF